MISNLTCVSETLSYLSGLLYFFPLNTKLLRICSRSSGWRNMCRWCDGYRTFATL